MPWYSPQRRSLSLVRTLSREEEVYSLTTPQGLLLSGEVGTGKTMLMDMFFNSIPIEKKRRWHHHALMLELYSRMHRMKPSVETAIDIGNEYVLLRIARDLIQEANVLAVDEFQLPDPYLHFLLNSHQRCRRNNKTGISVLLQTWRCPRRNHKSSP
jgi:predicted ATPase